MSEYPEVYEEYDVTARKTHRCCECDGQILKGETYRMIKGLWDGNWRTYKTCPECHTLRNAVSATITHWEDQVTFGDLYEHIFEFESIREHPEWIRGYMACRRKREAPPSPKRWMERKEDQLERRHSVSHMKVGDQFQACPKCFWRLDPGEVARNICPECRVGPLSIMTVTEEDFESRQ